MAQETTRGPSYYQRGSIQVWDFIRDQGLTFHLGNAIKYICRYGHKGGYNAQLSDLKKAIHYLQDELNSLAPSRNSHDLYRYDSPDTIVLGGSGVSGGLSDNQLFVSPSTWKAAEPYSGGVQGVLGSGRDAISLFDC